MNSPQLQAALLHPRYWLTWFAFGLFKLITRLPHAWQIPIGAFIGGFGYYFARNRRHIAEVNIALCFPMLTQDEQKRRVRKIFRSIGIGVIETANAWLNDAKLLAKRVEFKGLANLQSALDQGRGVLLVGMHQSTLDYCGAALASQIGFDVMYRRNKNPLIEYFMTRGRQRNYPFAIERDDIRALVKHLKQGHAVWYGPDQDYGVRHSVFVPFFGIQAATITATARFAKISDAPVIFFSHYRSEDDQHYTVELSRPLENYPSDDVTKDAQRINRLVETAIMKAPDQYWWIHRRFKTQVEGLKRPY